MFPAVSSVHRPLFGNGDVWPFATGESLPERQAAPELDAEVEVDAPPPLEQ